MEPKSKVDKLIFRERVRCARERSPDDKILSSLRLFELRCHYMAEEIRAEFPNASERLVQMILAARLERTREPKPADFGFPP